MALSKTKQSKIDADKTRRRRVDSLWRVFPRRDHHGYFQREYPFFMESNWDSDVRHYVDTGRLRGYVLRHMGGRSDVSS